MKQKKDGPRIAMYGFDAAGYAFPSKVVNLKNDCVLEFVSINDGAKLETFDGVVVPQGIFEQIRIKDGYMGDYGEIEVAHDRLLERERQVRNLIGENKWVCFLVGTIQDRLPTGDIHEQDVSDTDLCKRVLNAIGLPWTSRRLHGNGVAGVTASANEFVGYIRDYGVAKTSFEFPYGKSEYKALAKAGPYPVGFEFAGRLFFLPFHSTKKDGDSAAALGRLLVPAILDYRQKQQVEVPEWAASFRFQAEAEIKRELDALAKRAGELQLAIQLWDDFKAVLTSSGEPLRERVILAFERFFGFNVDPIDEGREDAKLLDPKGAVIALLEIKGTKQGVRREHISQADAHRDRNELPATVPGLLVINSQMDVPSIEKRMATTVDVEQIKHAGSNNVLIVRTVELLLLMRHLEASNDRKGVLLKLLAEGGGWLQVDDAGYRVVKG